MPRYNQAVSVALSPLKRNPNTCYKLNVRTFSGSLDNLTSTHQHAEHIPIGATFLLDENALGVLPCATTRPMTVKLVVRRDVDKFFA